MNIPRTTPDLPVIFRHRMAEYNEAVIDPRYSEAFQQCQSTYRHWDKVRFIAASHNLDPELLWAVLKLGRLSLGYCRLPFYDTNGNQLRFTMPSHLQKELMLIDQALAGRLLFEKKTIATEGQRNRFIIDSFMEEAIASSQLEGASTIHRIAKDMLRRNRPPRDRSERMILNNYNAILFIKEHRNTSLSTDLLLELHSILTKDTLDDPDKSGRFRRPSEHVVVEDPQGEELHMPPEASTLDDRLALLCDFANDTEIGTGPFIHPVVRAMTLHFQLAYDHPFCDGNGRTARMLFYWSALSQGYWMFEFMPISRLIKKGPAKYGRAFLYTESDSFDLTYFLDFHLRIIRLARRDFHRFLERKRRETQVAYEAFSSVKINARQRALLMHAHDHPNAEYTIELHRSHHGVSYYTARDDLLSLEQLDYLSKIRIGKKFVFSPTPLVRQVANRQDH